ncbi:MAG: hypothetical protein ABL930_05535 [Pseudobdellovibrio sp.]
MAYILFDHGKKVGEITDWVVAANEPVYKNVLGKTVLSTPANNECSFVCPKPVNRKKSKLTVIQDGIIEFSLQINTVKGATFVTALIVSKKNL